MVDVYWDYINPTMGGLILLVNLLELVAIYKIRGRMETSMVFILNLAISDLLVGVMIISIKLLINRINTDIQLKKDIRLVSPLLIELYMLFNFGLMRLSLVNSVLNLTVITIDRVLAVSKPILYRRIQQKHARLVCLGVWVISISIIIVYYCILKYHVIGEFKMEFDLLMFPLLTIPTLFILLFCYLSIIKILQLLRKDLNICAVRSQQCSVRDETCHLQREWKVIKLAIAVVTIYFLCWMPLSVYGVLRAFKIKSVMAEDVTFGIALLNSFFDPIVYFHHIRREIGILVGKIFHRISYCFHVSAFSEEVTADILLVSVAST